MDWITDVVAIGNYLEAQNAELLRQHAFRSALSLDGTLTGERAVEMGLAEIVCVRLIDGVGNDLRAFRSAVESLRRLSVGSPPVLVQCHAGRSRSAVVVAGYLMQVHNLDPEEAIRAVGIRRSINITPALVRLLDKLDD